MINYQIWFGGSVSERFFGVSQYPKQSSRWMGSRNFGATNGVSKTSNRLVDEVISSDPLVMTNIATYNMAMQIVTCSIEIDDHTYHNRRHHHHYPPYSYSLSQKSPLFSMKWLLLDAGSEHVFMFPYIGNSHPSLL